MGEQNTQAKGQKNSVELVGNLGGDPKVRKANNEKKEPYATFSLGNHPDWRHTKWFRIMVWDKELISIAKEFKKGDEVEVAGRLDSYEDKDLRNNTVVKAKELRLTKPKAVPQDN